MVVRYPQMGLVDEPSFLDTLETWKEHRKFLLSQDPRAAGRKGMLEQANRVIAEKQKANPQK